MAHEYSQAEFGGKSLKFCGMDLNVVECIELKVYSIFVFFYIFLYSFLLHHFSVKTHNLLADLMDPFLIYGVLRGGSRHS